MSIQAHLVELESKHKKLEEDLSRALQNPGSDMLEIAELKKRKLKLKEQIMKERKHA